MIQMHKRGWNSPLGVVLAILLGTQPLLAAVSLTKNQQLQYVRFVEQLLKQSTPDNEKRALATAALGELPCQKVDVAVMGSHEWQELQIEALIRVLDKTKTSLGHVALRQMMQPMVDTQRIEMRKEQVKTLMEDPHLFTKIGTELERIRMSEDAVLSYWDEAQYENQGALFYRAKDFYYALLAKPLLFGDRLNDNRRYLEALSLWNMGKIGFDLLLYLGLQGVLEDAATYSFGIGNDGDNNVAWNPWKSFTKGLQRSYLSFSPWCTKEGGKYAPTKDQFSYLMRYGSMGDLFKILRMGFNDKSSIVLGGPGRLMHKAFSKSSDFLAHCPCGTGWVRKLCDKGKNLVDENGDWVRSISVNDQSNSFIKDRFHDGVALTATGGITYYRALSMYEALKTTINKAKNYITTMKELHRHTMHTANALGAMQNIAQIMTMHTKLSGSCTAHHMHEVVSHASCDLKKLLELLKESTFTEDKEQSQIFSRGNVLLAHRLFEKIRNELVPLFQAIGEVDAVYAMAQNIKEHEQSNTPYTFVEFLPETHATIELEHAWLPMVKQPVTNSMQLGNGHKNKLVITGPNGGGKSIFLKMLGCSVLLAQSWGIVPAQKARMSVFNGIRSCIHPQESIEHELSTFMAEKMRIDEIRRYIFQNNAPGFNALLLLDEPFKGTVDAESADRIYNFGKEIASLNGVMVAIATHVEKPIYLAEHTGAYENYHVTIHEPSAGKFERKFTIEPGILRWWFDDPDRRSRFIDFVTLEKHKEELQKN